MDPLLEPVPGEQHEIAHNLNRHEDISVNIKAFAKRIYYKTQICYKIAHIVHLRRIQSRHQFELDW